MADRYVKSAVTGEDPGEEVPAGFGRETPLSYMTRPATEARARETADWISAHFRPERRYRRFPGRGLRQPQLRRVRKTLAGRYY